MKTSLGNCRIDSQSRIVVQLAAWGLAMALSGAAAVRIVQDRRLEGQATLRIQKPANVSPPPSPWSGRTNTTSTGTTDPLEAPAQPFATIARETP